MLVLGLQPYLLLTLLLIVPRILLIVVLVIVDNLRLRFDAS